MCAASSEYFLLSPSDLIFIGLINPNQAGLFGQSTGQGGWNLPMGLFELLRPNFHQISQNMVSNETWHLNTPIKTLSNIL